MANDAKPFSNKALVDCAEGWKAPCISLEHYAALVSVSERRCTVRRLTEGDLWTVKRFRIAKKCVLDQHQYAHRVDHRLGYPAGCFHRIVEGQIRERPIGPSPAGATTHGSHSLGATPSSTRNRNSPKETQKPGTAEKNDAPSSESRASDGTYTCCKAEHT